MGNPLTNGRVASDAISTSIRASALVRDARQETSGIGKIGARRKQKQRWSDGKFMYKKEMPTCRRCKM
jgi:hypothetical protein